MINPDVKEVQVHICEALNDLRREDLFPGQPPEVKDAIYHLEQAYMALGVYKESQGATV